MNITLARMSVFGYRGRLFEPRQQYVVSLSKTLYPHCFSRLSCEMSTRWDNLVKDVQCYELFGGIAPKNHAFSFSITHIKIEISVLLSQFRCTDCALKHPTQRPLIVFVQLEIECTLIKLRRSILVYEQVEE